MLAQGSRNIGFMDFKGLTTPEHFIGVFNAYMAHAALSAWEREVKDDCALLL
jgi:hypothetical protein